MESKINVRETEEGEGDKSSKSRISVEFEDAYVIPRVTDNMTRTNKKGKIAEGDDKGRDIQILPVRKAEQKFGPKDLDYGNSGITDLRFE